MRRSKGAQSLLAKDAGGPSGGWASLGVQRAALLGASAQQKVDGMGWLPHTRTEPPAADLETQTHAHTT